MIACHISVNIHNKTLSFAQKFEISVFKARRRKGKRFLLEKREYLNTLQ